MLFNELITNVAPSKSVTLMEKTKNLQKTDSTIINLTGGEPDFPTPEPICEEINKWLKAGYTHYTSGAGEPELLERIARKLNEENNAPYTDKNIVITPGAKFAVYIVVRALINPGDEAMWLTPGWVSYPSIIEIAGGTPKAVHLKYEDDYAITKEALEAAVSDKTKLLIINYPNNPTGRILTESDLEAIRSFMMDHPDIYLISDEIYEKIIYGDAKHISPASLPELFYRTVIINGFSKASAMTGWRIGYLACNPDLKKIIMKLYQHTMSCTSGFLQKGAVVAMDCHEETEYMRSRYEARKNILVNGINNIPGMELINPDGAFYAWVKFDTALSSQEICDKLLDDIGVAGVPGEAYGEEDVVCVRFSFASSDELLMDMVERLKNFTF